jgi:hypothetical protein
MTAASAYEGWLRELTLDRVRDLFSELGVRSLLFKDLPRNANSKNQVYLGPDLSQLGRLPSGTVLEVPSTSGKPRANGPIFQVPLRFGWVQPDGRVFPAPGAKLVAYPQYPEVRLSGFLAGADGAPSHLFRMSADGTPPPSGRSLFLGVRADGTIAALALPPEAPASNEIRQIEGLERYGVMLVVPLGRGPSGFARLSRELCRIHRASWLDPVRLGRNGLSPTRGPNSGGYTLEAHLGIVANGLAEPDFDGWEVKSRTVPSIDKDASTIVTLFTPEPSFGRYVDSGPAVFTREYGYPDTAGRPDRINFGGCYRVGGTPHARTGLRLALDGFDPITQEMRGNGAVILLDAHNTVAAGWSFTKLLDHWKCKHALAVYVPCEREPKPGVRYRYGNCVLRACGAQFRKVLLGFAHGLIAYDPGIKIEHHTTAAPKLKRRSQFRIASKYLGELYSESELVRVCR